MRVLVVGGAGFLGSVTIRRLQGAGFRPVYFDSFETGCRQGVRGVEGLEGDLRREEDLRRLFSNYRADAVILLFGVPPLDAEAPELVADPHARYLHYLGATFDFVRVLREYGTVPLVYASTLDVYGHDQEGPVGPVGGLSPAPADSTGRLALAVESFLRDCEAPGGLRPLILRFGWIAGADRVNGLGDDRPRPYHWLARLVRASRLELRDGSVAARVVNVAAAAAPGTDRPTAQATADSTCHEVIHVLDAADALVAALGAARDGLSGVYDVGCGGAVSPPELVEIYEARTGLEAPAIRPPDPRRLRVDPARACAAIGWEPQRSTAATIVGDALDWRLAHPDGYRSAAARLAAQEASQAELFGEIAMRLGYITPQELVRALEAQKDRLDRGADHQLLGFVLLEQGLLNNVQLIEVLRYYEQYHQRPDDAGARVSDLDAPG